MPFLAEKPFLADKPFLAKKPIMAEKPLYIADAFEIISSDNNLLAD